jgi:hypothetical protein
MCASESTDKIARSMICWARGKQFLVMNLMFPGICSMISDGESWNTRMVVGHERGDEEVGAEEGRSARFL